MRKFLVITFSLMILPVFIFAQNGSIEGKVVNKKQEKPISGANVFLQGTSMGDASDTRGNFTIEDVPAGEYTIAASVIGYQTIQKEIE